MKIIVEATEYLITDAQVTSPALEVKDESDIVVGYGYLTSVKPTTPTMEVSTGIYLNQPRIPFTITLAVSLSNTDGTSYSAYLSQLAVYNATWSFSGSVHLGSSDWIESSSNHGAIYKDSTKIYDIGHDFQETSSSKAVYSSGTLKSDSQLLEDVSTRMRLDGVGTYADWWMHGDESGVDYINVTTYLTGTLTITGYKLP